MGADVETAQGPGAHMGLFSGITMIVGVVVGSGIFASPTEAYASIGSVGWTFVFWVLTGLLTTLGAFCWAELGCMMPQSGGEHNYLMKSYGKYVAYSFDWTQSLLTYPLSCAAIAFAFASYTASLFANFGIDLTSDIGRKMIAVVLIMSLTVVNMVSPGIGAKVTNILTIIKFGVLAALAVIGFVWIGKGNVENFQDPFSGLKDIGSVGAGLYQLFFCFGGWNNLNYCLGELKNPEKKLPFALMISLSLVIVIYVSANLTYFAVLPLEVLRTTDIVATLVGEETMGRAGRVIIPIMVMLCAMGAVNGLIFANARLIATFASDGVIMPKFIAKMHPVRQTPIYALILTCFCCLVLVMLADSFAFLVNMYGFSTWLFFTLTTMGLLILRWKYPHMRRPFRVWTPVAVVFLLVSIGMVIFPFLHLTTLSQAYPYIATVIFAAIPLPIVFFVTRFKSKSSYEGKY